MTITNRAVMMETRIREGTRKRERGTSKCSIPGKLNLHFDEECMFCF